MGRGTWLAIHEGQTVIGAGIHILGQTHPKLGACSDSSVCAPSSGAGQLCVGPHGAATSHTHWNPALTMERPGPSASCSAGQESGPRSWGFQIPAEPLTLEDGVAEAGVCT